MLAPAHRRARPPRPGGSACPGERGQATAIAACSTRVPSTVSSCAIHCGAMIGHAQPQWTLPEGAQVEIDATADTIALLESPVA